MKVKINNSAEIIGRVRIGSGSIVAQGTIIRSENDSIKIGNSSFILENTTVIGTEKHPVEIGSKTVFGHKCTVIGATLGNLCEVGNCTTILEGAVIGDNCIFGEGTLILPNTVIPDNSVVLGRPGKIIRKTTDEDLEMIKRMRSGNIELLPYEENIIENIGVDEPLAKIYEFNGKVPKVGETTLVMGSAEITGDVVIGESCYIASGVKIVGDSHGPIIIGNNVQILENSVLHLLPENQLILEDNVVIGPNSMIHGTIIGENTIVESSSIVCDFSKIGKNSLIKSGALISQRKEFEDNDILEGFPAKSIGKNKEILERPNWINR